MNAPKYAVTFIYSFDTDRNTYLFESEDDAKAFLKANMDNEYNIDKYENGWDTSMEIKDDGRYIVIANVFPNGTDYTEGFVSNIQNDTPKS